jgi:NTE family protein
LIYDLEQLVKGMDWPLIIGGETPDRDLSFRRKEDARAIPTNLVIGFKRGVSLPSGLNAGHQISLIVEFIGGSVGDTGHAKWFFSLGPVF